MSNIHRNGVRILIRELLLICCPLCRFAPVCAADCGQDYCAAGNNRKRSLWGGVAREVEGRRRSSENLLIQRGALLVQRG